MKKRVARLMALSMAAAMTVSLAACGGGDGGSSSDGGSKDGGSASGGEKEIIYWYREPG